MAEGDEPGPRPAAIHRRPPLTRGQRLRALVAGLAPIALVAVSLSPFALVGAADTADVLGASFVYGGLLGLAAGFVYVDRVHARQCPRCGRRSSRQATGCSGCGYDLVERPRYACTERHAVYLDPGLCDCGRRLQQLEVAHGLGRELAFMLKLALWLLAFFVGVGLLLPLVARG